MLLTGGLLVLGVVALLGAVLLARGEVIEESKPAADPPRLESTTVSPAEMASPGAVETPIWLAEPAEDIALVTSKSRAFEQFLLMYEQFQELVEKIQAISERSKAIEERLTRISELVQRIEEDEPTLVGISSHRRHGRQNAWDDKGSAADGR